MNTRRSSCGSWTFSCFMVGMAIGPLVGGLLLEHFRWGSAFLLGVPFMVLVLATGLNTVAAVGVVVFLVLAALTIAVLRRPGNLAQEAPAIA